MGKRKYSQFGEAAIKNGSAYVDYVDRLTELAVSMFNWSGLPDSCDERYLELNLFREGAAIFFFDADVKEYLTLKMVMSGGFDVYGIPAHRTAYGYNGYQYAGLNKSNSVIIYNNMIHSGGWRMVNIYAHRLYELDRIIEVNANAQKTPVLVQATEKQRLTMKNLYMQYDGNYPYIFGDESINPDTLKAFRTDAPFVADKLYQLKTQIWNEALTYFGISNMSMTKRERLVSDEVSRTMGGTIASRYSRLSERKRAAEKINEMFNLNVQVDFRPDIVTEDNYYSYSMEELPWNAAGIPDALDDLGGGSDE